MARKTRRRKRLRLDHIPLLLQERVALSRNRLSQFHSISRKTQYNLRLTISNRQMPEASGARTGCGEGSHLKHEACRCRVEPYRNRTNVRDSEPSFSNLPEN